MTGAGATAAAGAIAPSLAVQPVLLHVGLHKCASTWLQRRVFHDPALGFAAPWGPQAHTAVTSFVTVDPIAFDPIETRARLERALPEATGGMPVFSHEALSSRPHHGLFYAPQVAERLKAVFPEGRLLIVLREQRRLIFSLYGEHVRNGGRCTMREFIGAGDEAEGWDHLCRLPFFEFDRLVGMYCDVFGADRVLALPLEMLPADPEGFVTRLYTFAELERREVGTETRDNTGWGAVTIELVRRLNGLVRANPLGADRGWAYTYSRKAVARIDRLMPRRWHHGLEQRQRAMIDARLGTMFEDSNRRLAEMIGLDLAPYGYYPAA
ncbi:MAG: hypothetical protein AAFS07_15400 [Pseudomonadota bacterium]